MNILNKTFNTNDVIQLLKLSIPLVLSGLIESASPFIGTMFLSELGQKELAAGALVRGLFFTLMVILWGTLNSVSVLVSQKHGEKNDKAVSAVLRDGVILSLILTPPSFLLLWYVSPLFLFFGQNQSVVLLAQSYLRAIAWGILPDFIGLVLMQFLIGIGHTRLNMVFMLFWVPMAVFFNYVLVFGMYGFPKLGIAGLGWGLTASYWISVIGLIIYLALSSTYKHYLRFEFPTQANHYLYELLRIGVPLGTMYGFEVGFFFVLILMMGLIGDVQLAATQIVMQYLGMLTAVVFSISSAITVRMGHKLGEKDMLAANSVSQSGVFLCFMFMLIVAACYFFVPEWLIAVDLNMSDPSNKQIIQYTKQFFIICALFQLFEAVRIALMGSLRALKQTNFTLLASIVGFWIVPFPLGYLLSRMGLGGAGIWWGMTIGAGCNALLLWWWFQKKMGKGLR